MTSGRWLRIKPMSVYLYVIQIVFIARMFIQATELMLVVTCASI